MKTDKRGQTMQCVWWLAGNKTQCLKPTRYTVEKDEDGRTVYRKYRPFCDEHERAAAQQEADEFKA